MQTCPNLKPFHAILGFWGVNLQTSPSFLEYRHHWRPRGVLFCCEARDALLKASMNGGLEQVLAKGQLLKHPDSTLRESWRELGVVGVTLRKGREEGKPGAERVFVVSHSLIPFCSFWTYSFIYPIYLHTVSHDNLTTWSRSQDHQISYELFLYCTGPFEHSCRMSVIGCCRARVQV